MLTKDALYLIALCQTFLDKTISDKDFCPEFEKFFVDDNNNFTEEEAFFFDDILEGIAFYEPDKEERDAEPTYIDENELKRRILEALNKIGSLEK